MSFIFILLILVFFYFVLKPVISVWMALNRAKRQTSDFFRGGSSSRQEYRQGASARGRQPRHRKKIDPNVGEYVDFEDIPTYTSSTSETRVETYQEVEEQISDVEWEDIK